MGLSWPRKAIRIYRQIRMGSGPGRSPAEGGRRVQAAGPPVERDLLRGFGPCSHRAVGDPHLIVQEEQPASLFPSLYSFTLLHYFCFIEIYKIQIREKNFPKKGVLL